VLAVVWLIEQPNWQAALEELQRARTILLLGATDTGKTTFLTWLGNNLLARQRRIAIVDADVGQSSLGPPTTIGLSLVAAPFQSLQDLRPAALYFVGSTSPRGHLLPMTVGTKRLVDRAHRLGVDHVVIDTCGFISAEGGQALKYYQIDLVNPDTVVCLQRGQECEPILLALRYRQQPRILRLWASPSSRRRSTEERRQHRAHALRRYFGQSKIVTLMWDDVNLLEAPIGSGAALKEESFSPRGPLQMPEILWAEQRDGELHVVLQSRLSPAAGAELARALGIRIRIWLVEELHGTLLGLLDEVGEAVGIGVLRHIDFADHRLEVLTAEGIQGVRGVHWSRTRMGPSGDLQRVLSMAR
jgi:polynucleotide 5'-hydroxyl-kinase GRC3/NOL9